MRPEAFQRGNRGEGGGGGADGQGEKKEGFTELLERQRKKAGVKERGPIPGSFFI